MDQSRKMAKSKKIEHEYFVCDSDSYKLGDKGIEYLSKAKWPQLMKIELSKLDNSVGK